jgi:putative transposase
MKSYHKKASFRNTQSIGNNEIRIPKSVLNRLDEIHSEVKDGLMGLAFTTGLAVMKAMMEEEIEMLVGPKGKHISGRTAYRHGTEKGRVTCGGQKIEVDKPRVRTKDGEELPIRTYEQFKSEDPLGIAAMEKLLYGLSTRKYAMGLENAVREDAKSISRDSVSRRFKKRTKEALEELMAKKLDDRHYVALFIDGHGLGDYLVITVMGMDVEGKKHILGIREGATENASVCKELLQDLVERGLDTSKGILVVIDGAKALRSAVKAVFGDKALVQRCQVHKMRNVLEHLPDNKRAEVKRQMAQAYNQIDAATAKKLLENLARNLEHDYPSAATSLREGLDETLTVIRLHVPGTLKKTLKSTNPIESTFNGTATHMSNVKRWRNGEMALRWMTASLLEVEKRFKRVKGYKEIPILIDALSKHVNGKSDPLPLIETA